MKSHIPHITVSAVCLTAMLAGACSDELDVPTQSETRDIRFTASVSDTPGSGTRGSARPSDRIVETLPMIADAGKDTMYLHTEILDWEAKPTDSRGMTRSNMVHSGSGMYESFNVSAYQYTDEWTEAKASLKPNYFYFEGASGTQTGGYTMDSRRYWPSEGKLRFIAYAPYDPSNTGAYQMANVDNTAGPYVHITVDTDATKHKDLLVAYSQEIDCSGTQSAVNLNFKHALACIQFVMADDMPTSRIKKITVKGAINSGDMRFRDNMTDKYASSTADASLNNSYHPWDGTPDITLSLIDSDNPNGKEVNPGDTITDENHSFMMFPQLLPNEASIEITLSKKDSDGNWGADEVMYAYISGKRWPAGKIIRYRVSENSWWQELQVSTLPAFPPQGGEKYFNITSFEVDSLGQKQPVVWTVQYEDPSNPGTFVDTNPGWYSFNTANDGAITPESVMVTANETTAYHELNLDSELKKGSQGTQTSPYNLSTETTGTGNIGTTANCYIVDRPGWYAFPLVYGNGITNGSDNTIAYHPNTDTSNGALKNFVNYLGAEISSPYILTDCSAVAGDVTSGSAKVVWQDHQNLIRNENITVDKTAFGGKGGIIFQITEADIIQGNCVIGLEIPGQTGKMIWSWHIWVTPFYREGLDPLITETIDVTNNAGKTMGLMFTNLGWSSLYPLKIYSQRTSKVRFSAKTAHGTLTKDLLVEQAPFVRYWHGSNTYYQWGRKDPFMPFLASWTETWYDSTGAVHTGYPDAQKFGNETAGLTGRIQNPSIFHISDKEPIAEGSTINRPVNFKMYTNLWNGTLSSAPVVNKYDPNAIEPVTVPVHDNVKTVYDPCPPGFKVPPVHTFTGFTTTGNNIGEIQDNPKNWNGTLEDYQYPCGGGIDNPYIYLFYANPEKTIYIAFPLTGYRDWADDGNGHAGASYQMGNYGYSWTAGVASETQGYYLELRKDQGASGLGWVQPLDYFWQNDGMPIRPCKE